MEAFCYFQGARETMVTGVNPVKRFTGGIVRLCLSFSVRSVFSVQRMPFVDRLLVVRVPICAERRRCFHESPYWILTQRMGTFVNVDYYLLRFYYRLIHGFAMFLLRIWHRFCRRV